MTPRWHPRAPVSANVGTVALGSRLVLWGHEVQVCAGRPRSSPPPSSHYRLPVARSAHGATVYSDKLWIFAGYDGNAR